MTNGLYVCISKIHSSFICCNLDSAVVLFIYKYLGSESKTVPNLYLVIDENQNGIFKVQSSDFNYISKLSNEIDQVLDNCMFPIFYFAEKKYFVAGLCAVLRQVRIGKAFAYLE